MKDHIRYIDRGLLVEPIFCFPKKHYTKEQAIKYYKDHFGNDFWEISNIEEHQVGLFHNWERASYEYDEYDEYWRYEYCDFGEHKNKKYSERFAPNCWCIETDLTEQGIEYFNHMVEESINNGNDN